MSFTKYHQMVETFPPDRVKRTTAQSRSRVSIVPHVCGVRPTDGFRGSFAGPACGHPTEVWSARPTAGISSARTGENPADAIAPASPVLRLPRRRTRSGTGDRAKRRSAYRSALARPGANRPRTRTCWRRNRISTPRLAGDLRIDANTAPTNLRRLTIPAETSR
jgi:hypothetical protein